MSSRLIVDIAYSNVDGHQQLAHQQVSQVSRQAKMHIFTSPIFLFYDCFSEFNCRTVELDRNWIKHVLPLLCDIEKSQKAKDRKLENTLYAT